MHKPSLHSHTHYSLFVSICSVRECFTFAKTQQPRLKSAPLSLQAKRKRFPVLDRYCPLRSQQPFIYLVNRILAGKKAGEDTLSQRTRKANSMKCSFVSIVFGS
jgi:hypothetical protein